MTTGVSKLWPASVIQTFDLSELVDANGIKTAIGTFTSPQSYSGADLNGAVQALGSLRLPRGLCVTTSTSVGRYNVNDPIVWNGLDWEGETASVETQLTNTNGNEIVCSPDGLMRVISIDVPAQLQTGGQFEFGVRDIVLTHKIGSDPVNYGIQLTIGSSGNVHLGYTGDDAPVDPTVPSRYRGVLRGSAGRNEQYSVFFTRVYGTALTTADPFSVAIVSP